jgi:hypothetical protein
MTERLYPLIPTPAVDSEHGHFEPEDDGGFDFPGPLAAHLHSARFAGKKLWETSIERQERTHGEDLDRRRDPAVLYDAVDRFAHVFGQAADSFTSRGTEPLDPDAEIAELRRRLAELEDGQLVTAEDGPATAEAAPDPAEGKAAAKRKPPAAKDGTPAQ